MRLASFFADCRERIGFVSGEASLVDLTLAYESLLASRGEPKAQALASVVTPPDMIAFIEGGESAMQAAREAAEFVRSSGATAGPSGERLAFSFDEVRWRAPVRRPSKIVCVALNNPELIENAFHIPRDHPIFFLKATSSLVGHGEPIEVPDIGIVHPEAELAVVIGRKSKHLSRDAAKEAVFGYSILNDVTAASVRAEDHVHLRIRNYDRATGQSKMSEVQATPIGRHKGYDTFAPMGPWIVTKDELDEPSGLEVTAWMGKEVVNKDNTGHLRFQMPQCLEWISSVMTLHPGDVVTLGTASSTEEWPMLAADLRKYDWPVRITVDRIGTLENPVVHV